MHRANNAVIMQTEQLGRIEALEEELQSSRAKMVELEQKLTEQDRIIAQLVGDNLDHLQDSMCLTAHCHRTIFFTRIFVHFQPNFTSHSLPHLSPLCLSFLFHLFYAFMLTNRRQEPNLIGTTGH